MAELETVDLSALVRPVIRVLSPYRSARERIQEGILLDANENPFPRRFAGWTLNRYPDPLQSRLRRALARRSGLEEAEVLAGNGSDEIIDWILKVFCEPGSDAVAVAEPTYGMYRVAAQTLGVHVLSYQLDQEFQFQAQEFLRWVPSRVKLLFLCSPNNPTGNLLDPQEILKVCRSWGRIVVVDEAYIEFAQAPSLSSALPQNPNLLLLRTLSKAWGAAGLRLGYVLGHREVIQYLVKVKAPYNLGTPAQELALKVLSRPERQQWEVRRIISERERLEKALRGLRRIEVVYPSQANFLLVRCARSGELVRHLMKKGIIVRDRSDLPGLQDCVRISVGSRKENTRLLKELRFALEESH